MVKFKIDTVKKSFLKFIDDNCECLCPIILTDQMFIELEDISKVDRATIDCVLCLLDTNPIGINSSMLLNDLVRIEVEYVDEIIKKPTLEHLTHRKFDIEFFDCKLVSLYLCVSFNLFLLIRINFSDGFSQTSRKLTHFWRLIFSLISIRVRTCDGT